MLQKEFTYKNLHLKNRIVLPPMCQYAAKNNTGLVNEYHMAHYLSIAIGGAGMITVEMTNIEPNGRISNQCLGLWNDAQISPLQQVVDACHNYGSKVSIQIGHAGRKAGDSMVPVAPSAIQFSERYQMPRALTTKEAYQIIEKFGKSVKRAVQSHVDTIEIHGAHGYLIHQFHSPLTNIRQDEFGKDLTLFGRLVIEIAKRNMPKEMPLIFRISAKEYIEGGYDVDHTISLCKSYIQAGADIIHVTSGGESPMVGSQGTKTAGEGFQVSLASTIKNKLNVPVIAVGNLHNPTFADDVLLKGHADLIAVGRGMLHNPNWSIIALQSIGADIKIPRSIRMGFQS